MKPKQTRNRPKRPTFRWSGMSATEWRATPDLVLWAQSAPHYRDLLTLLINDQATVLSTLPDAASENCLLGRHQAYNALVAHFKTLTEGVTITAVADTAPDYPSPNPTDDDTTVSTDFLET